MEQQTEELSEAEKEVQEKLAVGVEYGSITQAEAEELLAAYHEHRLFQE